MPPSTIPGYYSLPKAGRLVGKSASAMRKRLDLDQIEGITRNGVAYVKAKPIEEERAELLARIQAIDARPGRASQATTADPPDRAELERLRAENRTLQAVVDSLGIALRAARESARHALEDGAATHDAFNQLAMPHAVPDHP